MNLIRTKQTSRVALVAMLLALVAMPLALGGCQLLGVVAQALPPDEIQAAYKGLVNQKVAVMVWADRGVRIDWEAIQLDTAVSVQNKLKLVQPTAPDEKDANGKPVEKRKNAVPELAGVTWTDAASVVRFQREHPDIDGAPVTDIAPRLGVTRLIYVEIDRFATRSERSLELFRGSANASVRVVEVDPVTRAAKVVFSENNVMVKFPQKIGDDGTPNGNDVVMYNGTVDALSTAVAKRFIPHEADAR